MVHEDGPIWLNKWFVQLSCTCAIGVCSIYDIQILREKIYNFRHEIIDFILLRVDES